MRLGFLLAVLASQLSAQSAGADGERQFYTAHRADVLEMLRAAVPADRLHLGHRLVRLRQQEDDEPAEDDP